VTAREAQQCADLIGAVLPTPKLLDLRFAAASCHVDPQPKHYPGGRGMSSDAAVRAHSQRVSTEAEKRGEGIVSNVGKHWVLHDRALAARAVLYGWHVRDNGPTWRGIKLYPSVAVPGVSVIQPVSTAHGYGHHDYSMTLLCVAGECVVDGERRETAEVYTDPALAGLVTASGRPLRAARLPGVPVEVPPAHPSQEGSMREESADEATGIDTPANVGLAVLELARQDLDVREDLGRNDGHRIREYLAEFGLSPPQHWCASALGYWLRRACQWLGVPRPIEGSAGAQATMGQFRAAGRWIPADAPGFLAAMRKGNVVVWRRGPPGSWQGHIGVIESCPIGGTFWTIEANSGPRGETVARMRRTVEEPRLLGVGILDTVKPPYTPSLTEYRDAERLMRLSADVMRGEDADPLAALEERLANS
jgi:hypothetical protein